MNLYLDDNSNDPVLAALLRKTGRMVVCPQDVKLSGRSDARHLDHALMTNLVLLTGDREDFGDLHHLVLTSGGNHPGIILVRYDNDSKRDMRAKHIIKALDKLERSGLALANQIVVLNHWR